MGWFNKTFNKVFKPVSKILKPVTKILGLDVKPTIAVSQAEAEKIVSETAEEAKKKKKALLASQSNQYWTSGGQLGQELTNGQSGRSNIFGN